VEFNARWARSAIYDVDDVFEKEEKKLTGVYWEADGD
jgi:hypothetical protein